MSEQQHNNSGGQTQHGGGETQVTFARNLGLFDATMIGVGAMIGAGIFVLTGLATQQAGPAAILAFSLNGVVTLFTAFSYAELASAIPEAGGGYSYIKRAFPQWVGFMSGWMLWFAYTVACALYALGFGSYFWELLHKYAPDFTETVRQAFSFWPGGEVSIITILVGVTFIALNVKGAEVTGKTENALTMSKIVILLVFVAFGIAAALGDFEMVKRAFTPFLANGMGGVLVAMGLTFIAFEGYDLIATVSEEVQDPTRNIPKAIFISLGITIVIYLLIIFVTIGAWQSADGRPTWVILGEKGETAVVEAAAAFMPAWGVALIVFGGLLSTISALNATILASSRVAFSMGRDRMLPKALAAIHPKTRTPHIAIIVSGVILLVLAVSLDITVIGSAASVMFLLTFALVNMSVLVLRNDRSIKRLYTIPFYPWPPLLGVVTSIFLAVYQLNLGPEGIRSWLVSLGWIISGLAIYFTLFHKEAAKLLPKIMVPYPERARGVSPAKYRVLVPVYNPENVQMLVGMACQLVKPHGDEGEVVVVSVVEVPVQLDIKEGLRFVSQRESVLRAAELLGKRHGVRLRSEVRVAHNTGQAILQMAKLEGANLLILGWRGFSGARENVFGSVVDVIIDKVPCDLLVVKFDPELQLPFKRILLPTAGGPSAKFAATLAGHLLEGAGTLVLAGVSRPDADEQALERMSEGVAETIAKVPFDVETERKQLTGKSVPAAVIKEAKEGDYCVVMVGAAKVSTFKRAMFGKIPEQIARYGRSPVILVKAHEGARTWLNRLLGS